MATGYPNGASNPQGDDTSPPTMKPPPSISTEQEVISPEPTPKSKKLIKPPAIPLRGVVQHYAWGKPLSTSIVAHMATEQVRSKRGTMRAPPLMRGWKFAELWMGTHSNGHSSVILPGRPSGNLRRPGDVNVGKLMQIQEECSASSDDEGAEEFFLGDVIRQDPAFWLGPEEAHRKNIPFLFKVLSVGQALSVQAHPNKALAAELHEKFPGHYPDDNHKPEICIPLGHFEALCGFRPIAEVRKYVKGVPELNAMVGLNEEQIDAAPLKELFSNLMTTSNKQQTLYVVALINRLKETQDLNRDEKLIVRISEDYPLDVGLFSVFFLNYVVITKDMPNRFIYCAPDEPHAYLCGDAVECMALSDNVVRAGLTQKYKDVDTLLRMMTYRDDLLDELVNVGERIDKHVVMYNPPVDDFLVYEIDGPVPDGLILPRAAIAACISGMMVVDFKPAPSADQTDDCAAVVEGCGTPMAADVHEPVPWSWKGAKKIRKGHTLFSKAGTQMIVVSAEPGSKIFIATY